MPLFCLIKINKLYYIIKAIAILTFLYNLYYSMGRAFSTGEGFLSLPSLGQNFDYVQSILRPEGQDCTAEKLDHSAIKASL